MPYIVKTTKQLKNSAEKYFMTAITTLFETIHVRNEDHLFDQVRRIAVHHAKMNNEKKKPLPFIINLKMDAGRLSIFRKNKAGDTTIEETTPIIIIENKEIIKGENEFLNINRL